MPYRLHLRARFLKFSIPKSSFLISPTMSADFLKSVTILGDRTRHFPVRAPEAEPQPWLDGAPTCAALSSHQIIHLGIVKAEEPYRFVRTNPSVTQFLACIGGAGYVMVNGEWVLCESGKAVLFPQHSAIAYHAVGGKQWKLVWVCYRRSDGSASVSTVSSPVFAAYDAAPLYHAVYSLQTECLGKNDPDVCQHLIAVIHRLVLRFAQPWKREDRLHRIWEKVTADLESEWTLDRLAREAHCSGEHLRRLCQKELGRSPIQHVIYLRLQKAATLLVTTDSKIESIAGQVGYRDAYAFSSIFKKWMGCSPTEYRQVPPF